MYGGKMNDNEKRDIPFVGDGAAIMISRSEQNHMNSLQDEEDKKIYIKKLRFNKHCRDDDSVDSTVNAIALIIESLKEINGMLHDQNLSNPFINDNLYIIGDYMEIMGGEDAD